MNNCCKNSCCPNKCIDYIIYEIEDLFNCNSVNFQAIPQNVLDNLDCFLLLKYIDEKELKSIFGVIYKKWCYFIDNVDFNFPAKYVTKNLCKLRRKIYKLFVTFLDENIWSLIYYVKSLDYEKYKNISNFEQVYTVNDETERHEILNLHDMQLGNITNQNSTSEKRNTSNPNQVFDELSNRNNKFNNLFNGLINILDANISRYWFPPTGIVCGSKI